MLQHILQRLARMVREVRKRFQAVPGHTVTKSASQRATRNMAKTNGHVKPRPKRKPTVRVVKKR